MSAGKSGGLLNRLVITPLISLTLLFTGCYFVLGPSMTASFAKTTTSALGYAAGVVVGSLPNLFNNLRSGQTAAGGSSGLGGSTAGSAPAQPQAPAATPKATPAPTKPPARDSTGNRSNPGTDHITR